VNGGEVGDEGESSAVMKSDSESLAGKLERDYHGSQSLFFLSATSGSCCAPYSSTRSNPRNSLLIAAIDLILGVRVISASLMLSFAWLFEG
jgi:hypothetical protein